MAPEDRIGTPHIPVDPEKVVAIVESDYPDQTQANAPEDDTSRLVTLHRSLVMLYRLDGLDSTFNLYLFNFPREFSKIHALHCG